MGTRSVRRGIGQAVWNKQFDSWYSFHLVMVPIVLALIFQPWWVLLISYFLLHALVDCVAWVRIAMLGLFASFWGCFAGFVAAGMLGSDAGWVFGIFGFGVAYVTLECGWQYWYDLY